MAILRCVEYIVVNCHWNNLKKWQAQVNQFPIQGIVGKPEGLWAPFKEILIFIRDKNELKPKFQIAL